MIDDGSAWQATNTSDHRDLFRRAVERAGLDPDQITSYALRHSSIVRALLGGVPVAVVAQQHDTSVREIEAHYDARRRASTSMENPPVLRAL